MSLNLYNKILSIIEDNNISPENNKNNSSNVIMSDSSDKFKGGVAMTETMENLVGGNTNENLNNNIPNIIMADSSEKLEGGVRKNKKKPLKEIDEPPTTKKINENLFEGGGKKKYSDFLHRLNTAELFHDNNDDNSSRINGGAITDNNDEENDNNVVEVLPMFPYLIRY